MKMRELEARTGVRREMIHFYFRNDLLPEPDRPKPNVAEYGEEHVRGIQAIRRLQTEQRLSIDEIKRSVNGHGVAGHTNAMAYQHLDELVGAKLGADETLVPLSSVQDNHAEALMDAHALAQVGAISLIERDGEPHLSRIDARIVAIWGEMRASGFHEGTGFEPEVTELYVARAKDLAAAEIAAFEARAPVWDPEPKAELAQKGLNHMMSLFALLRMKAVLEEFRKRGA